MVATVLIPDTPDIGASPVASDSKSDGNDAQSDNDKDDCEGSTEREAIAAPVWESAHASLAARKKRKRPTASLLKNAMRDLDRIWMNTNAVEEEEEDDDEDEGSQEDRESNREAQHAATIPALEMNCIRQTTDLLVKVFTEDIHEPAIRALTTNEELKATQLKLKSELETKQKEIKRLRRSEQRSKEAMQNLLKAVSDCAEQTKDKSQWKLVEAKMRADLTDAISERDAAKKDLQVARRSFDLLAEDVENIKKDRTKLQHDKIRLEREVRSVRALAEELSSSRLGSGHHKEDLDYYKGKSKELEIQLQGMTARLAEKNEEILELRRCNNRNLSQQRLETLRAAGELSSMKRARKSY